MRTLWNDNVLTLAVASLLTVASLSILGAINAFAAGKNIYLESLSFLAQIFTPAIGAAIAINIGRWSLRSERINILERTLSKVREEQKARDLHISYSWDRDNILFEANKFLIHNELPDPSSFKESADELWTEGRKLIDVLKSHTAVPELKRLDDLRNDAINKLREALRNSKFADPNRPNTRRFEALSRSIGVAEDALTSYFIALDSVGATVQKTYEVEMDSLFDQTWISRLSASSDELRPPHGDRS